MIPGIMAGQMRIASGGGAPWTPLNMAVVPQIYLDAQDSVVTDVSGACSAISNLGAMGANGDFSQATAANRPAILSAELNGKRVLRFDGTDDSLVGDTAAQKALLQSKSAAWAFSIYKKRTTDDSAVTRTQLYISQGANTGSRFRVYLGRAGGGDENKPAIHARRLDADSLGLATAPAASSTSYAMLMALVDYAVGAGQIIQNGGSPTNYGGLTTTGSTSGTPSVAALEIGALSAGGAADMDLAAVVISNTAPSGADIDKLFGWAAHKYGLTANLPGGHPYKTVAPTI